MATSCSATTHATTSTPAIWSATSVNSFSLVLSDEVTHGRNIIGRPGTTRRYALEDIDEDFVRQHHVLHLENADPVSHRLAAIMRENGGIVCLRRRRLLRGDAGHAARDRCVHRLGVLLQQALWGERGVREEPRRGPRARAEGRGLHPGDKGSVVAWEDGWSFAPGFKVPVVDTLGAGDVYHGGLYLRHDAGKRRTSARALPTPWRPSSARGLAAAPARRTWKWSSSSWRRGPSTAASSRKRQSSTPNFGV